MSESPESNGISITYLVELISSIKSALHNLEGVDSQNADILAQVSENLSVLSEIYKRQNQEGRIHQEKAEAIIKSIDNLSNKLELIAQQIIASNDKISSNVAILNNFKKEHMEDIQAALLALNESFLSIQSDVTYLKNRENQKELATEIQNIKKEKNEKDGLSEEIEATSGLFEKLGVAIKNFTDSIGMLYKIMLLATGILLLTLWIFGIINADDLKNIISFKFF